jgi:hypothetical protein
MKKLIASTGLVMLGAAGLHAELFAPGYASADGLQPWGVAATLRGFYDNNYNTAPNQAQYDSAGQLVVPKKAGSYGLSIQPSVTGKYVTDTTDIGARYVFGMFWYEARPNNQEDFTHQFDIGLNHRFSPRYSLYLGDSFVIGQYPELLSPNTGDNTLYRSDGSNIRNTASAAFSAELTGPLSAQLSYNNTLVSYDQKGVNSYSALLDRMDHLIDLRLRYSFTTATIGTIGYKFQLVDFSSSDKIYYNGQLANSDIRNSQAHYLYVGVDHTFNPDLTLAAEGGAIYNDSVNLDYSNWAPYAQIALRYRYASGSYATLGFRQDFSVTDAITAQTESSVVYAEVKHAITPKLQFGLNGSMQYRLYKGGPYNDDYTMYYTVGTQLAYFINRNFWTEVGYSYDIVDDHSYLWNYQRNRVYIGVSARY